MYKAGENDGRERSPVPNTHGGLQSDDEWIERVCVVHCYEI